MEKERETGKTPMKNIILHVCCAICSLEPLKWLKNNKFAIEGLFYNPNIHPYTEYLERLNALKVVIKDSDVSLIISDKFDYEQSLILKERTCERCYEIRLKKTAKLAKSRNITNFSTTLLASPYQNYDLISKLGNEIGQKTGINFIATDKWQNNYFNSKNQVKKDGLYVQKYCGCIYSKMERKLVKR